MSAAETQDADVAYVTACAPGLACGSSSPEAQVRMVGDAAGWDPAVLRDAYVALTSGGLGDGETPQRASRTVLSTIIRASRD
jgi:hypothetical protein